MSEDTTLLERLRQGDIGIHELEEETDHETAAAVRRQFLEAEHRTDLEALGEHGFDQADATANVENAIGAVEIPVGVAGPLQVDGAADSDSVRVPLATTEGALVASVNRGCSVITAAGGATARVTDRGMTRAPAFRVEGIDEAERTVEWVRAHHDDLRAAAEETTSHGELQAIEPYVVGDTVFFRFAYDTKDAMGMNMATIATSAACDLIEAETPASLVALSGNLCADKKPAAINAVEGRGRTVTADVTIPADAIEERLGTQPAAIEAVNTRKNLHGSAKAGGFGFNAHVANVVAAIFLATGQDAAQVVEGANAITTVDVRSDGSLYASVSLASLEVGTVGGGTKLPTQQAGLELLGLAGGGEPPGANADRLAEIIAATALGGELSLLAAMASRHLASAHEELGR